MDETVRRGGNPSKFTTLKQEIFLGCLRAGMRRGEAARRAGVSRQSILAHSKKHPEYAALEEQAEIDACEIVEDACLKQILEKGNPTLIMFWLQNRAPHRWCDRRTPVQIINQLPDKDHLHAALLKKLESLPPDYDKADARTT